MLSSRISRTTAITAGKSFLRRANVHVEAKMAALGLQMPEPAVPKGNFVNYVVMGDNTVFLSGHLPQPAGMWFPKQHALLWKQWVVTPISYSIWSDM